MLRIASLLRNFRNPANTSILACLQANLLHVSVWWVKPVDSNLHINMHRYLLLTLISFNLTFYFFLIMLNIILKSQNIRIKNVFLSPFDSFVCFYLQLYNHVIIIPLPLFSFYNKHKTLIKPENIYCKYWNTISRTIAITNIIHITAAIFCWFFLLKKFI